MIHLPKMTVPTCSMKFNYSFRIYSRTPSVSEAIQHLMIWRMLGEWWFRKHQKGNNAVLNEMLIIAKRQRQKTTKCTTKIKTSKEISFSPCFSNRHYRLVSKNVNIQISLICPLLLTVNDRMNGKNKYITEVHSNGNDIKFHSQHTHDITLHTKNIF
jgi:hypothetical protein